MLNNKKRMEKGMFGFCHSTFNKLITNVNKEKMECNIYIHPMHYKI